MLKFIRIPLIILLFLIISALGTLACLLRPFHPDNTRIFAHIFAKVGLKVMGINLTAINQPTNFPDKAAVYIVNHQHNLDLFVTGAAVPKRTVTMGKKSLKLFPLFGQLYWLAGNVFVDRKNTKSSSATLSSSADALVNHNTSIWVFAEGTRNHGKNMLPFKSGAFRMAIEAQVPIIPICFSSYVKNTDLSKWHAGDAAYKALPPISTKGFTLDDCNELKELCWKQMMETIEELDKEMK
jgi:1-acyl-sn-glycerol-3-phosphate acyltransferase